jgi:hypothetical protein
MHPRCDPTETNEIATLISQQLAAILPGLVTKINRNVATNSTRESNGGCYGQTYTFKHFRSCKPQTYLGSEGATGLLQWFESMENTLNMN